MAGRFGSGTLRLPIWAFAVAGFVLVVTLFFAVRALAPNDAATPGNAAPSSGGRPTAGRATGDNDNGGAWHGGDNGGRGSWSSTNGGSSGTDGGKGEGDNGGRGSWSSTNGGSSGTDGGKGEGNTSNSGGKKGGGSGKGGESQPPGWLPWGPESPNTDEQFEPDSIYDVLQAGNCKLAYDEAAKSHASEVEGWEVDKGLAGICMASQGDPQGMDIARTVEGDLRRANYTPSSTPSQCKDGDAYDVLKRFVAYYTAHPDASVVLRKAPRGEMACETGISNVFTDGSPTKPGTNVTVAGTWPDAPVKAVLNAKELAEPLVLDLFVKECCKDAILSFDLPTEIEGHPSKIDLTIRTESGAEVTMNNAFTIGWEESPPASSGTPTSQGQGVSGTSTS